MNRIRIARFRFVALIAAAAFASIPVVLALASSPDGHSASSSALGKERIAVGQARFVKASGPGTRVPFPRIAVRGNLLVDGNGDPVRLLGVNRPGPEYQCVEGEEHEGVFEGPADDASIRAMLRWRINSVRVPLNESCWLGIGRVEPARSGEPYRAAVRDWVRRLNAAGLYVILDLHWAAPEPHTATGLIPLPDADHALDFWRSVAAEYRGNRGVLFDVYNEPHSVDWSCWQLGCIAYDRWFGDYAAVGMTQLVEAVRSTGARQPILLGGLDWARDLSGWLEHVPDDPAAAIVAANHTYDFNACHGRCKSALERIAKRYPVVTAELGEGDCNHDYIDPYMRWADRRGISYLGWAWYAADDLTCRNGPTLIEDFSGKPTRFGIGFREHFRRLAAGRR